MSLFEENDEDLSFTEQRLENVHEKEYKPEREHISPEQLLIKMAVEQLTPRQREIWEMYAYMDKSHEDISIVLGVRRDYITRSIKAIERKIERHIKQNKGAYLLLKLEYDIDNENI